MYFPSSRVLYENSRFGDGYAYTGREWDKETGLYYYRARYYDPMEGRFVSRDPIGYKGGTNLFSYTSNNPISYNDPTGLVKWSGTMAGVSPSFRGFGGGFYTFDLSSECINGKKAFITVNARGGGGGFGFPSATASQITFDDGLSYLSPSGFSGPFNITSANFGAAFVFGWTGVQLGNNFSDVSLLPSMSIGFDASISVSGFGGGQSTLKSVVYLKCDCK
jgi:RHS repeat-associated protein